MGLERRESIDDLLQCFGLRLVLQEFRLVGFHLAETFYCVSQTGACTRGSRYHICYLVTEGFLRRELSYGLSVSDAYGIDR